MPKTRNRRVGSSKNGVRTRSSSRMRRLTFMNESLPKLNRKVSRKRSRKVSRKHSKSSRGKPYFTRKRSRSVKRSRKVSRKRSRSVRRRSKSLSQKPDYFRARLFKPLNPVSAKIKRNRMLAGTPLGKKILRAISAGPRSGRLTGKISQPSFGPMVSPIPSSNSLKAPLSMSNSFGVAPIHHVPSFGFVDHLRPLPLARVPRIGHPYRPSHMRRLRRQLKSMQM